jgi:hypothetical protein
MPIHNQAVSDEGFGACGGCYQPAICIHYGDLGDCLEIGVGAHTWPPTLLHAVCKALAGGHQQMMCCSTHVGRRWFKGKHM